MASINVQPAGVTWIEFALRRAFMLFSLCLTSPETVQHTSPSSTLLLTISSKVFGTTFVRHTHVRDVFILWNSSLLRPNTALSHTQLHGDEQWTMPLQQNHIVRPPTRPRVSVDWPLPDHSWKHSLRWTPGTAFRFLRRPFGRKHVFSHRVYHSPPISDRGPSGSQTRISTEELHIDFTLVYEVYEIYESPKWLSVSFVVGGRTPWVNVREWNNWIAEPLSTRVGSRWAGL